MNTSSVFKYIFFGLVILCVANFFETAAGSSDGWSKLSDDPWSGRRLLKRAVLPGGFNVPRGHVIPRGNRIHQNLGQRPGLGLRHGASRGHVHGAHHHAHGPAGHGKGAFKPMLGLKTPIVRH